MTQINIDVDLNNPRIQAAMARTPLDNASDELENKLDELVTTALKLDAISSAQALLDEFGNVDHLDNVHDEFRERIIDLAYTVVRTHHYIKQQEEYPTVDFEVFTDDHECPACGHIREDYLEDQADYISTQEEN